VPDGGADTRLRQAGLIGQGLLLAQERCHDLVELSGVPLDGHRCPRSSLERLEERRSLGRRDVCLMIVWAMA
jgi:hypothetical protein